MSRKTLALAGFSLLTLAAPLTAAAQTAGGGSGFPTYLFDDGRFWFFLIVNILAYTVGAWHTVQLLKRYAPAPVAVAMSVAAWPFWIFCVAYVVQFFHMIEHVAQGFQYWMLQLPSTQAHGILWFADLEWNHFLFNTTYEALLIIGGIGIIHTLRKLDLDTPVNLFLVFYPIIIQGWHVVEHTVRIVRHMEYACNPCPGILDQLLSMPQIPFHYWFDFVMLFLHGVAILWFGFHLRGALLMRRRPPAAGALPVLPGLTQPQA